MKDYFFSPVLNSQISDNAGIPLDGGLIYSYLAYTTTPVTTYSTANGVENSNPIVLDSTGNFPNGSQLWLLGGYQYRFVVKDKNLNTLKTLDGIIGINDIEEQDGGSDELLWLPYKPKASYVSDSEFSVPGDQRLVFQKYYRVYVTLYSVRCYGTVSSVTYSGSPVAATIVKVDFDLNNKINAENLTGVSISIIPPQESPVGSYFNNMVINGDMTVSGSTRVAYPQFDDSATTRISVNGPNSELIKSALNTKTQPPIFAIRAWVNIAISYDDDKIAVDYAGGNIKSVLFDNNQTTYPFVFDVIFETGMPNSRFSVTATCSPLTDGKNNPVYHNPAYVTIHSTTYNSVSFYIGSDDGQQSSKGSHPNYVSLMVISG